MHDRDAVYRRTLIDPLSTCADYLPKMGGSSEVDLNGFSALYGSDPLYHWMGLDSPLMFAAHKAAGGMTSIYRQLGIGCERLFRSVLRDELELTEDQVKWSYEVLANIDDHSASTPIKTRILSLDGRIETAHVTNPDAAARISNWIDEQRRRLDITIPLKGAVFEVRQGYKSADSKRQNGDLSNAAQAISHGFLPVLTIMSTQVNHVVHARYVLGKWAVLLGSLDGDPLNSTYTFLKDIVGYDMPAFFKRNTHELRAAVESTLSQLLEAK